MQSPTFDLEILSPDMRAALEQHAPEYLGLDSAAREAQRAIWGTDRNQAIEAQILRVVFGKTADDIAAIQAGDADLSEDEVARFNTLFQTIEGIGEDFFSWNESLCEEQTAASFETIGDYDLADHDFQEQAIAEETPGYEPKPYRGRLYGAWARILQGGEIRYVVLDDLASFVLCRLDDASHSIIQELVPHNYSEGSDNLEPDTDGNILWNMKLDAGGKEDLYEALSLASQTLINARHDALRDRVMLAEDPLVWLYAGPDWAADGDPDPASLYAVFSGPLAMDLVPVRQFLAGCAAVAGDLDDLKAVAATETDRFNATLRALHGDLEKVYAARDFASADEERRSVVVEGALARLAARGELPDAFQRAIGAVPSYMDDTR